MTKAYFQTNTIFLATVSSCFIMKHESEPMRYELLNHLMSKKLFSVLEDILHSF